MRPSWWAFILVGIVAGSAIYQLNQSSLPNPPSIASDAAVPQPSDQKSDGPLIGKDQARLQDGDSASAALQPDSSPVSKDQASFEDAPGADADTGSIRTARLPEGDLAPAVSKPDQPAAAQQLASLGDPASPDANVADPGIKQNLSWLHYYAWSELPPETKPADTVLAALKDLPPGTPIEEIRRVADILGLDVTFMKAVAKIESNFNPKQRTGSYIGLFQLSKNEFDKYGSGDLRDSRDNAIAAALKIMTEAMLFETFTHRKPDRNDLYLIHQQGVEGASQHVSHPNRLAWRSMCATDEGKEKGEKWCKRAIWGNTLPAIKRVWKNVNNVTSYAFVGMWQQRVTEFYSRYSAAAAN
jgi:hypothetical protein